MTNFSKEFLAFAVVAGVFGLAAFFGFTPFGKTVVQKFEGTASPAATTLNSAKIAEQVVTVTSSSTFSMLNSDATDRTILSADVFLTGGNATNTTYAITCATSTDAAHGLNANTNTILAATFSPTNGAIYGTTTGSGSAYIASTSPGITGTTTVATLPLILNNFARVWKTGSYLNCIVNTTGNVQNTFDSLVTGYISFPYRTQ